MWFRSILPRYSMASNLRKKQRVSFTDRDALEVMSEEFADIQRGDEKLVALRKAVETTTSVGSGFFILTYYGCPWALQYWIVQSQMEFDGLQYQ